MMTTWLYACGHIYLSYISFEIDVKILVTKPDILNDTSRKNFRSTLNDLLNLNIIPIINTNDAVASPPVAESDLQGVRII